MNEELKKKRPPHPRDDANILSSITFYYTLNLFKKGYKNNLNHNDLYDVIKSCRSEKLGNELEKQWEIEKKNNKVPSLNRALWRCFGKTYLFLGVIQLCMKTIMVLLVPHALGKLISFFNENQTELTRGDAFMYASIVVIFNLVNAFYIHNYMLYISEIGIRIRTAVCSLIYRKCLKLTTEALSEISVGKIISLITKDAHAFELLVYFGNDVWIGLIQTIVIASLIYWKIGYAAFAGVGFFVAVLPVQIIVGIMAMKFRLKANKKMDERLKLTQEALSSIKIIKTYAWEKFIKAKICAARTKELKLIHVLIYMKIIILMIGNLATQIAFFLLIMTHAWLGNNVTAEVVFFIITCFEKLRHLVSFLIPLGLSFIAELYATNIRILSILNNEEVPKTITTNLDKPSKDSVIKFKDVSVKIRNNQILKNVTLKLSQGLNIVSGHLGSGKTTFLKTILKEYHVSGILDVEGIVAYASQEPWLFPSSIKHNILFGQEYNEKRYQKVLDICALTHDLNLLDFGDNTIIGDRGLNLSRGQQARINLARAIYKEADIYLLDDCLSALDGRVADLVFKNCIQDFLKHKLIVFVTNNVEHIKTADVNILLNQGTVVVGHQLPIPPNNKDDQKKEKEVEETKVARKSDKILYYEKKQDGKVNWNVYKRYINFGGGYWIVFALLLLFIAAQSSQSYGDKSITNWVTVEQNISDFKMKNQTFSEEFGEMQAKRSLQLKILSVLMMSTIFLNLARSFAFYRVMRRISVSLHKLMITSVMNTKMLFFDTNFIGNILNRFSKDLCMIDEHIPFTISFCIQMLFQLSGIIFLVCSVNPWFLIPFGILFGLSYLIKIVYQRTGRDLQRMDASTRSPWLGHLNASLEGLTTIRAFKAQQLATEEFDRHQDLFTSANFNVQCSIRALGFVLDTICCLFVSMVIARFLLFPIDTTIGNVGLAISQAFGLTTILQYGVIKMAEFENGMTSIERALEYCDLDQEKTEGKTLDTWPKNGEIVFNDVSLQYSENTKPILKNLKFKIGARQRIGIVGRTGAGKSSIITALFRLYDIKGSISIDNENIEELALPFLRTNIAMIPQAPVLFTGTIRENLDPFSEKTDGDLWQVIKKVKLENVVTNLSTEVDNSLSAGQKQLLCLARAMIRNNKIVILDEATANLDEDTDNVICDVIDNEFNECTLIIIAHRLASVLKTDLIIVMNDGEIVEMDVPKSLIDNKHSLFYNMIKRT